MLIRMDAFLSHISFFTRIKKILKMSASPIAHTPMLAGAGPVPVRNQRGRNG